MKLYARDFTQLTDAELVSKERFDNICSSKKGYSFDAFDVLPEEHLKVIRRYYTQFPNNNLSLMDLVSKQSEYIEQIEEFQTLINNNSTTERDILGFIKTNKAYFIITSIIIDYCFGHHGVFIFPEFQLSNDYKPDYVIVGKNSDGYHFIFVELENPYGNITIGNGDFGDTIRKGINQTKDWNIWLQRNFNQIRQEFEKYSKEVDTLPNEFHNFDTTRIHYVVVAGRRSDFNEKSRRLRREELHTRETKILHYDNLIEMAEMVVYRKSY